MAMSGGGPGRAMSDINVTPLVDVMLVLLIIFMVTAPLLSQGVRVDLPKVGGVQKDQGSFVVEVARDGAITVLFDKGSVAVPREKLGAFLRNHPFIKEGGRPQVNADHALPYGELARVFHIMNDAGVTPLLDLGTAPTEEAADPEAAKGKGD